MDAWVVYIFGFFEHFCACISLGHIYKWIAEAQVV